MVLSAAMLGIPADLNNTSCCSYRSTLLCCHFRVSGKHTEEDCSSSSNNNNKNNGLVCLFLQLLSGRAETDANYEIGSLLVLKWQLKLLFCRNCSLILYTDCIWTTIQNSSTWARLYYKKTWLTVWNMPSHISLFTAQNVCWPCLRINLILKQSWGLLWRQVLLACLASKSRFDITSHISNKIL